MSAMVLQITVVSIVYSTVCSGADQRKHQSFALLAFVRGIHWWPVDSPYKGPVTRKCFYLMTSKFGQCPTFVVVSPYRYRVITTTSCTMTVLCHNFRLPDYEDWVLHPITLKPGRRLGVVLPPDIVYMNNISIYIQNYVLYDTLFHTYDLVLDLNSLAPGRSVCESRNSSFFFFFFFFSFFFFFFFLFLSSLSLSLLLLFLSYYY